MKVVILNFDSECQSSNLTRQNYKMPCQLKVDLLKFAYTNVQNAKLAKSGHFQVKVQSIQLDEFSSFPDKSAKINAQLANIGHSQVCQSKSARRLKAHSESMFR